MNVEEAAKKWGVKENTVVSYICKGFIHGLYIEDGEIKIPDIPKPYVAKPPKTIPAMDKYILNAMKKGCYVNPKIMNISKEKFEERLKALLKSDMIFVKDKTKDNFNSNLNFALACFGKTSVDLSADIQISPVIEFKVADQIGFVTGKFG